MLCSGKPARLGRRTWEMRWKARCRWRWMMSRMRCQRQPPQKEEEAPKACSASLGTRRPSRQKQAASKAHPERNGGRVHTTSGAQRCFGLSGGPRVSPVVDTVHSLIQTIQILASTSFSRSSQPLQSAQANFNSGKCEICSAALGPSVCKFLKEKFTFSLVTRL